MPTVSLDLFLPEISPIVVGCPEPVIKNALRSAAIEFCDRSLFWQERLAPVSVTSGSFPYSIPVVGHGQFSRVMSAHAGSLELQSTSYEALDRYSDWDSQLGDPGYYLINPSGQMIVYPLPSSAVNLRLTVAYTVAKDATVVEQFMFDRWRYAIVSGALKALYAMPDKGWSKPELATYHAGRFETGIKMAFTEARISNMARGGMCVTPRPFA